MSGSKTPSCGLWVFGLVAACKAPPQTSVASASPAHGSVLASSPEDSELPRSSAVATGEIETESSGEQASLVLDGMRLRLEAVEEPSDVELRFLAMEGTVDATVSVVFPPGRAQSLRCEVGLFSSTPFDGGYDDGAGRSWRDLVVDEREAREGSIQLYATMTVTDLSTISQTSDAGLRVCRQTASFSPEQRAKLAEFVDAWVGPGGLNDPTKAAGDSKAIGIVACDRYVSRFRQCIVEKGPQEHREALLAALQTTADAWRRAADGPGSEGLELACDAALGSIAKVTAAWGCEL